MGWLPLVHLLALDPGHASESPATCGDVEIQAPAWLGAGVPALREGCMDSACWDEGVGDRTVKDRDICQQVLHPLSLRTWQASLSFLAFGREVGQASWLGSIL